jgi:hypothetical protein
VSTLQSRVLTVISVVVLAIGTFVEQEPQ